MKDTDDIENMDTIDNSENSEVKKIILKDIEYDELIKVYQRIDEFLVDLGNEHDNVKKMEEENS